MATLLYLFGHAISLSSIIFFKVSYNATSGLRAMLPFSLNVPNNRRVSFHLFQSFFLVPCLLYETLYLQGAAYFLWSILLLTLLNYCWLVLRALILLVFYIQIGVVALFFYALHRTCICHILLIPCSFSMLLFLSFALAMLLLTVFSCSKLQPARVFFTMLLWYFTLKLLLFQNLLFIHSFVLYSRSFSIVSILLSI